MEDLVISLPLLTLLFSLAAFFYAAVGLGGGSAYTALLTIFGASTTAIPLISLSLNILITAFGSIAFFINGHARLRLIAPFLITSMPMAYIGGMIQLTRQAFYIVLIFCLGFAAYRIYFPSDIKPPDFSRNTKIVLAIASGALLGLIAGITGIGGGVYLVPLILLLGLGSAKEAAACGAFFIFVNSVSGLISRLNQTQFDILSVWPLLLCPVIAGIAGSIAGSGPLSPKVMQKVLGTILIVAVLLLVKRLLFPM